MSAREREIAVFFQRTSHLRICIRKIRKGKDIRIPESMSLITFSTEPLGADIHAVIMSRCHHIEVILGKPDCQLVHGILAVDKNRRLIPDTLLPHGSALCCQGLIPFFRAFL